MIDFIASNVFVLNLVFFFLFCLYFVFAKLVFSDILNVIRQRSRFLDGERNWRGFLLLVVATSAFGSIGYALWTRYSYGNLLGLGPDAPFLAIGGISVLLLLFLYKDRFKTETLKSQFQPIKEAFENIAQEMDVLSEKVEALVQPIKKIKTYLENGKNDYRWEDIEAQKETYNVCKAFFDCWDKYDSKESRVSQSKEFKRAVDREKVLARNSVDEMKKGLVGLLAEYQKVFYREVVEHSQRKNLPDSYVLENIAKLNALEFASIVDKIAVQLKNNKNITIIEKTNDDGMPWRVYSACLNGVINKNQERNATPDYDVRLDNFIKPDGFIRRLSALTESIQRKGQEIQNKRQEIQNLARRQDAEVLETPNHWSGKYLRVLLKKQKESLHREEKSVSQAQKDLEVLQKYVDAQRKEACKLATELLFARVRLVGKRAERWALGFEETLELGQELRKENLLDYERIFDVDRGYEIQNKALASSNPIIKKYETIIKHFEPDRFFNIELPFPMNKSDRQNLEEPVVELTKTLTEGIKHWRTATFNLMKAISKDNSDLIVARCTSYAGYQPGSSEMIVVIKPVVGQGNAELAYGGRTPRPEMVHTDANSDKSHLELNVPRSESGGLVELAYVVLRLTITQNKLKKIAGFSGLFADPNSISRDSPFYRPHDWKPGAQNGRYVCIGMTRGSNHGFNTGYSHGTSSGGGYSSSNGGTSTSSSWGTNESWNEGESEGVSESEYWVADFNVDPNFSKLTINELPILSKTIEDFMEQKLRDGDLGINQDYAPNAEKVDSKEIRNRKRFK